MADPGWYRDESDPRYVEWWDGQQWSGQRQLADQPRPRAAPTGPAYDAAPARKRKSRWPLYALLGALVFLVVAAIVGTSTEDDDPAGPGTAALPTGAPHQIGETAKTSDFEVQVFGVEYPYTSPDEFFVEPGAGNAYVSVDVQVRNTSNRQQPFSSILGLHLLDAENRQYDHTIVFGLDPGPPGGEFAPGHAVRGFVPFEVPEGTTGLQLRVQGSLTAAGALFQLTP